eukprot:CAMPEP_0116878428 /NCGR_PEP_ID=MMETSP0463-20121206/10188_1 /TAXON_ID=181622 /ORGANISM="Strombidinopsis sp, Strain SopsisLIS2011" /LENGTH=51 /DNA_ID=CAMNT_0004526659 /DNA_START=856 /DNA_END=1011 /DNA_ORIENTATION=-
MEKIEDGKIKDKNFMFENYGFEVKNLKDLELKNQSSPLNLLHSQSFNAIVP